MRLIADNLQMTRPALLRALSDRDPGPIGAVAAACEAAGADGIDLNTGHLGRDAPEKMAFAVEAVQAATRLPLFLDTADPDAMAAGAAVCRNPLALNGFSLEPEKRERILPLAVDRNADIVGYLLSPGGHVPRSTEERLTIAVELFQAAAGAGLPPERLVVDPVVAPLAWPDGSARNRDLLDIVSRLGDVLGHPVRTMAGLSNLTAGHRHRAPRIRIEQAYVPMLAGAGLDFLLLDIHHRETVHTARTCRLLLDDSVFSWAAVP